jgi:hypothetical protein
MAFAEDMTVFFNAAEFAEVATWGNLTANVIFDLPTDDVLGGQVISNQYIITLPATEFPGITRNALVVINDVGYIVREVRLIRDGKMKELTLGLES